jgi:hypothetical protein
MLIRYLAEAMPTPQDIRERLAARDRFSLAEVRRWMADESDLELWAAVYDVLGPGWKLIKPEPEMDETCVHQSLPAPLHPRERAERRRRCAHRV